MANGIFLLRLVIGVALPLLDVRRRDRRHERLDLGAVERGLEVRDVALQVRVALVGDRPGADHAVLPRADVDRRVEFRERERLARADPGAAPRRFAVDLEAAKPFVDVGDEARLRIFAVVDDVDAELDLLLHDLLHRARQPRGAGVPRRPAGPAPWPPACRADRGGRGSEPAWVVRMRLVLCCMACPVGVRILSRCAPKPCRISERCGMVLPRQLQG